MNVRGILLEPLQVAEQSVSDKRPNIVLIMADDLGWSDLACFGSDLHETPNLDRFAYRDDPDGFFRL